MEPSDAILIAKSAVEAADLDLEYRRIAFGEVLRALLAGPRGGATIGSTTPSAATSGGAHAADAAAGPLGKLAARLGLEPDDLVDVYGATDDGLELHVPASRLPSSKKAATRDIALLVAGANEATGTEWTSVDLVRDTAAAYARYDQANFAAAVRTLGDLAAIRKRDGKREVRLTRPGWEALAALVSRLAGIA